jgi:hypothetical protein
MESYVERWQREQKEKMQKGAENGRREEAENKRKRQETEKDGGVQKEQSCESGKSKSE